MRFDGRVVLVTGAAGGIGAASATRFAREGATVLIGDVRIAEAEALAAHLRSMGAEALAVDLDVTEEAQWRQTIADCLHHWSRLDVLVNNAGVVDRGTIESVSLAEYSRVVAVAQHGVYLGMRACSAALKHSVGCVVNVSSMFGLVGGFGTSPAYHAAKGAVGTLTKNVAIAWASEGVRVNCVNPGFVETEILGELDREPMARRTPLGRLGTPEEVASAILFLASDDAAFITGAELVVDGGYTAA